MGLLDPPAYSRGQSDARFAYTSPRLAAWSYKLDEAVADTALLVVGDSTGAGTDRWVRRLADLIAPTRPDITVIYAPWDDSTKTYPVGARVTVQVGTGARTLTIYNGSVSGSAIAYARDNRGTLTSGIAPDVIFFNFGHNSPQLTDDYRAVHAETVQFYSRLFANAAVVLMTQNPRGISDSGRADDQGRSRAIMQYATTAGFDLADINGAFRAIPDYSNVLYDAGDPLHPNSAGSQLWAQTVFNVIRPSKPRLTVGQQATVDRVWVPATSFSISQGTPALVTHFGLSMWELDPATTETVVATTDIPSSWARQNIRAYWTTENGAAPNQVMWIGEHMYLGQAGTVGPASAALGTFTGSGGVQANAQTTNGRPAAADVWQRISFGASPLALRVGRNGAHANDNLAVDALFMGLLIERAY